MREDAGVGNVIPDRQFGYAAGRPAKEEGVGRSTWADVEKQAIGTPQGGAGEPGILTYRAGSCVCVVYRSYRESASRQRTHNHGRKS